VTVLELSELLAALPEGCNEWHVHIGGGPNLPVARVWVVVPEAGDDPLSPRVELRSALTYRAPGHTDRDTGQVEADHPPADLRFQ